MRQKKDKPALPVYLVTVRVEGMPEVYQTFTQRQDIETTDRLGVRGAQKVAAACGKYIDLEYSARVTTVSYQECA